MGERLLQQGRVLKLIGKGRLQWGHGGEHRTNRAIHEDRIRRKFDWVPFF